MVLEVVYQVDGCLRGSQVVAVSLLQRVSAVQAAVFLVVYVEVAHGQAELHAPTPVEQQVVAVGQAGAHGPTLVAVVVQRRQDAQGQVYPSCIELSAQGLYANHVSHEYFARPEAELGLYEPVLQLFGVRILPRLYAGVEREGGLASGGHFQAQVGCACPPV